MKNIKTKILIFLGLVTFITGCSEDYLVEKPRAAVFADNLFQSKDGFQVALNAVYSYARQERAQRAGSSFETGAIWKVGTDEVWGNYTYNQLRAFDNYGTNINTADSILNSVFAWLYDVVNASNLIVARSENEAINWQGGSVAQDLKNKNAIVAQARLLRAWAYRHLTNSWGDVPLNLGEITGETYKKYFPRVPVATVQAQMEQDLLFAEANLPADYKDGLVLSSAVAQHYLAELYLTMGGTENYKKAEIMAQKAIANPNFKLVTTRFGSNRANPGVPFMDMFNEKNALPSSGNTETLWSFLDAEELNTPLPGKESLSMRRTYVNRFYDFIPATSTYFNSVPGANITWAYKQYGGRGIGRASHTLYVQNLYEAADDRFSEFAYAKSYLKSPDGVAILTKVPTFAAWKISDSYWPSIKKWDSAPTLDPAASSQFNNMVYLRLAETYLLAAEAEFRLNKLPEAAVYINAVRARSHATLITPAQVTANFILDERARELVTEEHRRYVLNRFGVLVSRTKMYNKFAAIEDKNILFPLPQNFIDSNQGPTPQNPGW